MNTPAVLVIQGIIVLAAMNASWLRMLGMRTIAVIKHTLLEKKSPMPLACTICMATSGSGAKTCGTITI